MIFSMRARFVLAVGAFASASMAAKRSGNRRFPNPPGPPAPPLPAVTGFNGKPKCGCTTSIFCQRCRRCPLIHCGCGDNVHPVTLIDGSPDYRSIARQLEEMCGKCSLNNPPSWFQKQCDQDVSDRNLQWVAAVKLCGPSVVSQIENDFYYGNGYNEGKAAARRLAIARCRLTALFLTTSRATRDSMLEFYDDKILVSGYYYGGLWKNKFCKPNYIRDAPDNDIDEATKQIYEEIQFWKDPIHMNCPKMALHFRVLFHLSRDQLEAAGYRPGPLMTSGGNKIVFKATHVETSREVVLRVGSQRAMEDKTDTPRSHYFEIMAAKVFEDSVGDKTAATIVNKTEWYGNIKLEWTSEYFTPWLWKVSPAFKSKKLVTFEIQPLVQTKPNNFADEKDMTEWFRMFRELQKRLKATGWVHDDDGMKQIGRPLDAEGNPADYAIYVDWDVIMPDPEYKPSDGKYVNRWPRKVLRAAVNKRAEKEI